MASVTIYSDFDYCCCYVTSVVSDSVQPRDGSLPGSSVPGILQARILEWIAFPFSRDLPNPGIEPRSSHIAGRFFTS